MCEVCLSWDKNLDCQLRPIQKINSFVVKLPVLYPLKKLEKPWYSGFSGGSKMGTLVKNGSI